jgi:hypothetical protein
VRVAISHRGIEPDQLEQLGDALVTFGLRHSLHQSGSVITSPTGRRGSIAPIGSWKTICTSRRSFLICFFDADATSTPRS